MLANDGQLIAEFFTRLFAATSRFPPSYPKERLFALIQSFLRKEELKFLYTYVMPIFPVSYLAYIRALEQARLPQTLEDYLKRKHNWNLKMWLVMREKNIL